MATANKGLCTQAPAVKPLKCGRSYEAFLLALSFWISCSSKYAGGMRALGEDRATENAGSRTARRNETNESDDGMKGCQSTLCLPPIHRR